MPGFTPVPFYCEENIWMLLDSAAGSEHDWYAVVISNGRRQVALFNQKNETGDDAVIWDYHVVALERTGEQALIWDFNTQIGIPCPADFWLDASFNGNKVPAKFGSVFRVVPGKSYLASFVSDRSHMRNADGSFNKPPPPWPCIGTGVSNLGRYIDMEDVTSGRIFSYAELAAFINAKNI